MRLTFKILKIINLSRTTQYTYESLANYHREFPAPKLAYVRLLCTEINILTLYARPKYAQFSHLALAELAAGMFE